MLPAIRLFPSKHFYAGLLRDAGTVRAREEERESMMGNKAAISGVAGVDSPWESGLPPPAGWLADLLRGAVPPMVVLGHEALAVALRTGDTPPAQSAAAGGTSARPAGLQHQHPKQSPAEQVRGAVSVALRLQTGSALENPVEAGFVALCAASWLGHEEKQLRARDPRLWEEWRRWCGAGSGAGAGAGAPADRSQDEGGPPSWMRRRVGVISPYRKQVSLIRRVLGEVVGRRRSLCVDVSTVDGFQGQERDRVLISCVRQAGSPDGGRSSSSSLSPSSWRKDGIGFVKDPRRMCVALTRARDQVVVVGAMDHLARHSKDWEAFRADATSRGVLI